MKKLLLTVVTLFISVITFSQNIYTIVVDGKPVIMNATTAQPTDAVATPDATIGLNSGTLKQHTIKGGENLYSISRLYNVTVADLCRLNNIVESNNITVGEVLTVSTFVKSNNNVNNATMYTVVKGDTLYALSKKYGTTVEKLMELNGLTGYELSINQQLRLN